MATLAQIRAGMAKTILNGATAVPWLFVYRNASDVSNLPAAVIVPLMFAPDEQSGYSMGHSQIQWEFHIYVMVSRADPETAQDYLDSLVSGPGSIVQALYDRDDLYCDDTTDMYSVGMTGYGGHGEDAKIPLVGAVLTVHVRTDPRRH